MPNNKTLKRLVSAGLVSLTLFVFTVVGQDGSTPKYRSRAELRAARQNLEKIFPEEMHALRALHLTPEKVAEAELKLRRSETATRGTREELQTLLQQQEKQGYNHQANSERVNELRTSLDQAKDQLHSELKTLLTTQQRERFEQRLQEERHRPTANERRARERTQ